LDKYGDDIGFVYQDLSKAVDVLVIEGRHYPVFNEIEYVHDEDRKIIIEKVAKLAQSSNLEKIRRESTKQRISDELSKHAEGDSDLAKALQVYMDLTGKGQDSLVEEIIKDQEGKQVTAAPEESTEGRDAANPPAESLSNDESVEKETIIIDINKD
jgi:hypothetical protein